MSDGNPGPDMRHYYVKMFGHQVPVAMTNEQKAYVQAVAAAAKAHYEKRRVISIDETNSMIAETLKKKKPPTP